MKRSKFGGFVILGTAAAAVANSSVSVNALGVKDFFEFFSWSNFKSLFNCICSFIAERAGKLVGSSARTQKISLNTEDKIWKFYSYFTGTPNASLEGAKEDLLPVNFRKLIHRIAEDCNDNQIIHVWDKEGILGLPTFDGDHDEEFVLNGLTLVSAKRKVRQRWREGGYYHGWVVESRLDSGKILFIHPKGDLKDLGSGKDCFSVSARCGVVPRFEDMTEQEKENQKSYRKNRITEAEQNTPALDLELLKNHAPELYKFLENKGTKREVASILEGSEGDY